MRTEQLLRDTLNDLAGQARTPDVALGRILAGVPARPARRRGLVLVLAAVIVLALAVAAPTILVNRTGEPVGRVPGNWNLNHRVELPPGWEIKMQMISVDSESTTIGPVAAAGDPDDALCTVGVFAAELGDPTTRRAVRTPVTVNGRPAFYVESSTADSLAGVSWEYVPGAFALVSCGDDDRPASIATAEQVRFETVEVRLPFRFRSLPDGYEGETVFAPLTLADGPGPGAVVFRATEEGREPGGFEVVVEPGRTEVPPGQPGWETATIGGRAVVLSATDAELCLNTATQTACITATDAGEPADLTTSLWAAGRREFLVDLAERLVLAEDVDDPKTWFRANRAIPD